MKIALAFRQDIRKTPVECYPRSFLRILQEKGHSVISCGEGHEIEFLGDLKEKEFDCIIEIENGRNKSGEVLFQQSKVNWRIPSAVWLIDSHSRANLHRHISSSYSHVFFAPWIMRDIYKEHNSAHWCPNSTDLKWFNKEKITSPQYDFVFVGSKMGLPRADNLKRICQKRQWSCWIGEVSRAGKHKWPFCAQKMREGMIGYNWSQRQDAPNQRVLETMAVGIPLLQDICPLSGMDMLFREGKHYIGYRRDWSDLENKMEWAMRNSNKCKEIADNAYLEVKANHTIENRVNQILEVLENV